MPNRTWLITGVSTGFGRIMAEQLLARGDRVAGTVRDLAVMEDLLARYEDSLWLAELDLTDTPAIRTIVDRAYASHARIDVIVGNAGYGLPGAAEELNDEQIRDQIDANLLGSTQVIRAALPHMRAQGGGCILVLSGLASQAEFPGGARTDFRQRSAWLAPTLRAYDVSPSRLVNRILNNPSHQSPGDPARMVEIMTACVDQTPAPTRIASGSDAYQIMHAQISGRLAALEAQRDLAMPTDFPADPDAASPWFALAE